MRFRASGGGGRLTAFHTGIGGRFHLGRRHLDTGRGGQGEQEGLAGLDEDPAVAGPDLQAERLGGLTADDGRREEVLVGAVVSLPDQFRRGLGAQDVRKGQAGVLAPAGAELVLEPLAGLADGAAGAVEQDFLDRPHLTSSEILGGVGFEVTATAQVRDDRVVVAHRGGQEPGHDPLHLERAARVEREPERSHRVDRVLLGADHVLFDARVGTPDPVDLFDVNPAPHLVHSELVGLEPTALLGFDELETLAQCERLADQITQRPALDVLADVDRALRLAVARSLEDAQHPVPDQGVTLRTVLEHAAPELVVRDGRHQFRVDRVALVLLAATADELVPAPDRLGACKRGRDGAVGRLVAIQDVTPGPRVEVPEEETDHAVDAIVHDVPTLLAGLHVGHEEALAVTQDQRADRDGLEDIGGRRWHLGGTADRVGPALLGGEDDVATAVVLVLAVLDRGNQDFGGVLGHVRAPVDAGHVGDLLVLRAHDEAGLQEVDPVLARDLDALGATLAALIADAGEHLPHEALDEVEDQQEGASSPRKWDGEVARDGCG